MAVWWMMKTKQYVTLHSGTANNHQFTTTFNQALTFGEGWEVAVAQVHLPSGPFTLADAFKQQFPNNPVLGQLKIFYKTFARNDLMGIGSGQKSVRLNDIIGALSYSTSKYDVLKLIYTVDWNGIVVDVGSDVSVVQMHLRMNNQDFIPQVFKETSQGIKLEGTHFFGGFFCPAQDIGANDRGVECHRHGVWPWRSVRVQEPGGHKKQNHIWIVWRSAPLVQRRGLVFSFIKQPLVLQCSSQDLPSTRGHPLRRRQNTTVQWSDPTPCLRYHDP